MTNRKVWRRIRRREARGKPIPLLWVFAYKFDEDGYLIKCKAHLCVRGDEQITYADTYAATLAARVFRFLMAITAAFDLETLQLDITNAFLHAMVDEDIYCELPEGWDDLIKISPLVKCMEADIHPPQLSTVRRLETSSEVLCVLDSP